MNAVAPAPIREMPSLIDGLHADAASSGTGDFYWLQGSSDYANAAFMDIRTMERRCALLDETPLLVPTVQDMPALQRTVGMLKERLGGPDPEVSIYRVEPSAAIGSLVLSQRGEVAQTTPRARQWSWSHDEDMLLPHYDESTEPASIGMEINTSAVELALKAARPETWVLSDTVRQYLDQGPQAPDDKRYESKAPDTWGPKANRALRRLKEKQRTDADLIAVEEIVDQFGDFLPGIEEFMFRPNALFDLLHTQIPGSDSEEESLDTLAYRLTALDDWATAELESKGTTGTPANHNLNHDFHSSERLPFKRPKVRVVYSHDEVATHDLEEIVGRYENPDDWASDQSERLGRATAHQALFYELIRGVRSTDLPFMVNGEHRFHDGFARRLGKALMELERRATGYSYPAKDKKIKRIPGWFEEDVTSAGLPFNQQTKSLHAAVSGYDDYPLLMPPRGPEDVRPLEERSQSFVTQLIEMYGVNRVWLDSTRPMRLANWLGRGLLRRQFKGLDPTAQELVVTFFANRLTALREQWIDDQREKLGLPRFDKLAASAATTKQQ